MVFARMDFVRIFVSAWLLLVMVSLGAAVGPDSPLRLEGSLRLDGYPRLDDSLQEDNSVTFRGKIRLYSA